MLVRHSLPCSEDTNYDQFGSAVQWAPAGPIAECVCPVRLLFQTDSVTFSDRKPRWHWLWTRCHAGIKVATQCAIVHAINVNIFRVLNAFLYCVEYQLQRSILTLSD